MAPLVAAGAADRPTAVIVTENFAARIVEDRACSAGWAIPGDLSIIMCESGPSYTPFAAVVTHLENLCWRAVRIMEGMVAGHPPVRLRELVGCDLVVRASTAPPNKGH